MKFNKILIVPLLAMSLSLTGCNRDVSRQGVWEAQSIYFEEIDISISSIQIVLTEDIDLDYGSIRKFADSAMYTCNYSVWINNKVLTAEDNNYYFDMHNTTYYSEFTYENNDYALSVLSKKKVSGDYYFTGTIRENTSRLSVDVTFTRII